MAKSKNARQKLLDAAFRIVREKGYTATSVDELCAAAGVTKGAFFHHFKSKDDLAIAAANHWSQVTSALFATAPYHDHAEPIDRVLGYIDFRRAILIGNVPEFTCLVGTMVQETYDSSPEIREACRASIFGHAQTLENDIQLAIDAAGLSPEWTAKSLALHTQAVLQGAFILAKANASNDVAVESVLHLRRYIAFLLSPQPSDRSSSDDTQ